MSFAINPRFINNAAKVAGFALLSAAPMMASAQISLPIIDGIGCDIVNWMRGPLAVLVFLVVAVATFVIGLFAKMDWTKILTVVIIFGVLQGLIGWLVTSGTLTVPSCIN